LLICCISVAVLVFFGLSWAHVALGAQEGFTSTGSLTVDREGATATSLSDGRVLVTGGYSRSLAQRLETAEIYDPATGQFSATGSMARWRIRHSATLLADGRVLVAGGDHQDPATAEIYDPSTGTFSPTGSFSPNGREQHAAVRLSDGRVLIAGGTMRNAFSVYNSAYLFDPATGTFSPTGSMSVHRWSPAGASLPGNRALISGGSCDSGTARAERFDVATGSFTPLGGLTSGIADCSTYHSTALLPGGSVLSVGGNAPSAYIYDAINGTHEPTGSSSMARKWFTATTMADGRVLVAGGFSSGSEVNSAELYDPSSGSFSMTSPLAFARREHVAAPLPGGRVLIAGGRYNPDGDPGSVVSLSSAEVFGPVQEPPVNGESVSVAVVKGKVATKCRGETRFTTVRAEDLIDVGCQVDARAGTVKLTSAKGRAGSQSANFDSGIFRVSQQSGRDETVLSLTEPLKCRSSRSLRAGSISAGRSVRRLWGRGKGKFKTKGSKGSATVRGTEWLVEDRCDGTTLFRVKSGVVAVRDFAKKKTIRLKAGKSYVAGKKKRR
jgi:hypothetical protein